ncbi:MAG: glutathione S-transferase C-terminal domain-containing protein [Arenibacterium sp.]
MITLYSWQTPNPKKVVLLLEELGLPYEEIQIDPMSDAVRGGDVLKANPNAKIPAIVDPEGPDGSPITVFESGAILMYLAEKTKSELLPASGAERAATLEWLMWQMSGIGPMIGQYFHFNVLALEKLPYAIERYETEMRRLLGVLNTRLGDAAYVAGANYTIADISIFPWVSALPPLLGVDLTPYPNVKRWLGDIGGRPAVAKTWPQTEDA